MDKGSDDDSVAQVRAAHPGVTLLETRSNLGYAGGNNVGIRHVLASGADYVCILNNDIVAEPDFMQVLLAVLYSQSNAGIVTPLVAESAAAGESVWALGSAVDWRTAAVTHQYTGSAVDPWRGRAPFEVDFASGAVMLVQCEIFERVGSMDESFFLYFEEVDWSVAVQRAGYSILAVSSSVVWHKVSATPGTTSPFIDYYMLRNHLGLIGRHTVGLRRGYLRIRMALRNLLTVSAFTLKPPNGKRIPNRNARLLAMRDAWLGRWGKMWPDVEQACSLR